MATSEGRRGGMIVGIGLAVLVTLLTLGAFEAGPRIWLHVIADDDAFARYAPLAELRERPPPRPDQGSIAMRIWRARSISLEPSTAISTVAKGVVTTRCPEVKTGVSRTGRAEIATDPMGVEISDTYLMLKPRETWRFETKDALVGSGVGC